MVFVKDCNIFYIFSRLSTSSFNSISSGVDGLSGSDNNCHNYYDSMT